MLKFLILVDFGWFFLEYYLCFFLENKWICVVGFGIIFILIKYIEKLKWFLILSGWILKKFIDLINLK